MESSHGARAYEGVDSISISYKIYEQLYSVINRELNPFINTIFSVTSINTSEDAYNILPRYTKIKCSLRNI